MNEILIVEDDQTLNHSLSKMLKLEGFSVVESFSLAEARLKKHPKISLIVLDWMLGDGQGIDYIKELRSLNDFTPIILLTARNDLIDKVIGLETGANDYITKPFESRELIARIRVQLRQLPVNQFKQDTLIHGDLELDIKNKEIKYKGNRIVFTKMEFELLKLLMENPKQTFSRENLLDKVWGYENYPTTRTVDTHVLQIRQKTDDSVIETVRGLGYRLADVK